MFGMLRGAVFPTVMKRPFLIVTARATVLRPSIVWIWPLTSTSVSSAVGGGGVVGACAAASGAADVAAAPIAAAVAVPKKSLREMSDMVADSIAYFRTAMRRRK